MKTKSFTLFCLLVFFCCSNLISKETATKNNPPASATVNVYSSPELYDLTTKWAAEYSAANQGQNINVIKLADPGIAALISKEKNICFVSNGFLLSDNQRPVFQLIVGREIIVPVISSKNPFLKEIYEKGISREAMAQSLELPGKMQWGTLLNNGQSVPVRYFILNDDITRSEVEEFIKTGRASMPGMKIENRDALISAIQNDPYAIGFCRMTDILLPGSQTIAENLQLMPIDKNGNGKLDYMEKIYDNFQDFIRGVWIGKYPKALTGNICCIAKTQPSNETEVAFLQWVLTSGQEFLSEKGYCDLVSNVRESQLDKLVNPGIRVQPLKEPNSIAKIVLLVLVIVVALSFTLDLIIRKYRNKKAELKDSASNQPIVFDEKNLIIPGGLYFDKTHTWAFMEQDGMVKIGIDDFLQHVTGPITSIAMKNPGARVKKGDQLCILIQKGKHLILYAPVSGTVKAQNDALVTDSSLINLSPYSGGWVYRIEPGNWLREIEFLSMADKYRAWLRGEFSRLKDFLASSLPAGSPGYAQIILQDGGVLKDHVLADLGPEVWEDFQTSFINTAR
jgi:glycine cleavage system H lipoate-binding protein/ABC-type phosphate transport system substrate-binding protein